MARLPQAPKQRRAPVIRAVAIATFAVLVLCLLALLTEAIHPRTPASVSWVRSLVVGTPKAASTSEGDRAERGATPVKTSAAPPPDMALPTPTQGPVGTGPATPGVDDPSAASTREPQAPMLRLLIPKIGVDAPVEVKSIDANGVMQPPDSPSVVAWYDFSTQPGGAGNAVFSGHLDYAGVGPAVFWKLGRLQPGDEIQVSAGVGGAIIQYRVTSIRSYAATTDASQIVASQGRPTITLITCNGTFDYSKQQYNQRIVVTGDLID